jgi:hypothetical protein
MENETTLYHQYTIRPYGQTTPEKIISATSPESAAVEFVATVFGQIEDEVKCVVHTDESTAAEYPIIDPEEVAIWLKAIEVLSAHESA